MTRLAILIIFFPLVGFLALLGFGRFIGRTGAAILACLSLGLSFLLSFTLFLNLLCF